MELKPFIQIKAFKENCDYDNYTRICNSIYT